MDCALLCESIMTTDLIQEIKKRRSIRKYKQTPVKKEVIEEIIQAGKYAHLQKTDNHGDS